MFPLLDTVPLVGRGAAAVVILELPLLSPEPGWTAVSGAAGKPLSRH